MKAAGGLSTGHFRRIAAGGFGDGHNSYAYGYAWFRGCLFIGTNRDILVLARKRFRFEVPMAFWPVEVPEDLATLDLGAQIWRYDPTAETWDKVYHSPYVPGLEDMRVPLASGFRNMAVFRGLSDSAPALYTIGSCGTYGVGPVLFRSEDGSRFDAVSDQGLGLGDPNVTSVRSMVAFRDRLFMTPAGSRGFDPNVSYHARILCTEDPVKGGWEACNETSFGEPTNYGIYDMCVAGDYLYAGTMNLRDGCQLWKTDAEGKPPFRWTKVFDRGGGRGGYNQGVVSLTAFGEAVYLGTGIQNGGYDRVNNVGPDAGEVLRAWPDDSWELVAGRPRMTQQGLKVPASGLGPGFDNLFAGYIWRMCEHDGAIYVGTFDSSSMFPFADLDERARRVFDPATREQFMKFRGGCDLWRSDDGDHWVPVTRNGFENPYNWGIRTLVSSPYGLFVGTANPFGPKVAQPGPAGWRYEFNPRGGIEVWHGRPEHAGRAQDSDGVHPMRVPEATATVDGATSFEKALELPDLAASQNDVGQADFLAAAAGSSDGGLLEALAGDVFAAGFPAPAKHDVRRWADARRHNPRLDPLLALARSDPQLIRQDDELSSDVHNYFRGSPLRNVGYWRDEATTPADAGAALIDELRWLVPDDLAHRGGDALVIGHGSKAIAAQLAERLLNFSWTTLPDYIAKRQQRGNAGKRKGSGPQNVGAGKLPASFSLLVWVEGPLSAQGGRALSKAAGLLAPGGLLVASDLIPEAALTCHTSSPEPENHHENDGEPRERHVVVRESYRQHLARAEFERLEVFDITRLGWVRFCQHSFRYFAARFLHRQIDADRFRAIVAALPGGNMTVAAHVLVRGYRRSQQTTND